jgi:glycosyltransferase involved in cell wall biosynthesis
VSRIILNQQFLRTDLCGGAGTYAEQLVGYLNAEAAALAAEQLTVRVENAPDLSAPPEPAAGWKQRLCHFAIPPGLLPPARRLYRRLRPRPGAEAPLATPASLRAGLPWRVDEPCILHELTAYGSHAAIGDACTRPNVRICAMFHDLQDFFYPEFFSPELLTHRRQHYWFYKQYAALLFANSEFTKKTMVDLLGIEPERIVVTPLAGDDITILPPGSATEAKARGYGRYLIYPAKPWPHKNHPHLIRAVGQAQAEMRAAGLRLLLTGGVSAADRRGLEDACRAAGVEDLVEICGYLPRDLLQALLRHAELMIFPSLFEGFGMPVLEAMQLGCPVACSNTTSLPEVAGDAALLFDPEDVTAIARVIVDLAQGRIDGAALRDKGRRNIRRFTWDRTCRETLDGYRRLLTLPAAAN